MCWGWVAEGPVPKARKSFSVHPDNMYFELTSVGTGFSAIQPEQSACAVCAVRATLCTVISAQCSVQCVLCTVCIVHSFCCAPFTEGGGGTGRGGTGV